MARVHIGHTRLTHSYRLDRTARPQCLECQEDLTIEHYLIRCPQFENVRMELFASYENLNVLFTTTAPIHGMYYFAD